MADGSIRDKAAIAGIGTTEYAKDIGRSELQIALEAVTVTLGGRPVPALRSGTAKFVSGPKRPISGETASR